MSGGATGLDAFVDFRDWQKSHADEAHAFLMQYDEGEVLRFAKSSEYGEGSSQPCFLDFSPRSVPNPSNVAGTYATRSQWIRTGAGAPYRYTFTAVVPRWKLRPSF